MEYKKKSLANLNIKKDYEEIDTRLASGWYVHDIHISKKNDIKIPSITLDCFMQRPFWKKKNLIFYDNLILDLKKIISEKRGRNETNTSFNISALGGISSSGGLVSVFCILCFSISAL